MSGEFATITVPVSVMRVVQSCADEVHRVGPTGRFDSKAHADALGRFFGACVGAGLVRDNDPDISDSDPTIPCITATEPA